MQDIEFTVENNKLWMLQTRSGKRTAKSAIKIAVDMVKEKLITKKEAVLRVDPNILNTLLHPTLNEKAEKKIIASGLPASPGAASGKVTFSAEKAERLKEQMQDTILVRIETSPEDINGMHAAKGILTARGGMTSHAAVVARGMGKPCVSGSSEIKIDYENKSFKSDRQKKNCVKTMQANFTADFVRTNNINLHTFRHTYAHNMLNKGVPKEVLQTLLGHRSIKTTEIYANWVRKEELERWV